MTTAPQLHRKWGFVFGVTTGLALFLGAMGTGFRFPVCHDLQRGAWLSCRPAPEVLPPVLATMGTVEMMAALNGPAPIAVTASIDPATGGSVLAGNFGLLIPPVEHAKAQGTMVAQVIPPGLHSTTRINAGGPARFSPNGTVVEVQLWDARKMRINRSDPPVVAVFKPNGADLAMAGGDLSKLTVGYVVDGDWPFEANPDRLPVDTLVAAPRVSVHRDPDQRAMSVELGFIPSRLLVLTDPVGYVQTTRPGVRMFSSFNPAESRILARKAQFSYLQVLGPQVGTRLPVLDGATGTRGFVDVADIGPSGPPMNG